MRSVVVLNIILFHRTPAGVRNDRRDSTYRGRGGGVEQRRTFADHWKRWYE